MEGPFKRISYAPRALLSFPSTSQASPVLRSRTQLPSFNRFVASLHSNGTGFADRSSLLKAFSAVNGTSLCRFKRYCRFLAALRTNGLGFDSLHSIAGTISVSCSSASLARFTPLGFVLETLVGEKHLFAGGENELGTTFGAFQNPILIFHTLLLGSKRTKGVAAERFIPGRLLASRLDGGSPVTGWYKTI